MYWGGAYASKTPNASSRKLFARYPPEIPFNAKFVLVSWECSISGSPDLAFIRQAPRGRIVFLSVQGSLS